jgi:predicted Rossmann fold nucleotide-binding protein DprA/Smf involved in DNA uptake
VYPLLAVRALSPLARVVLDVLSPAPGTAAELARETKLPVGVVEAALAELVGAGRAVEIEPGRFKAR